MIRPYYSVYYEMLSSPLYLYLEPTGKVYSDVLYELRNIYVYITFPLLYNCIIIGLFFIPLFSCINCEDFLR